MYKLNELTIKCTGKIRDGGVLLIHQHHDSLKHQSSTRFVQHFEQHTIIIFTKLCYIKAK